MIVVHILVLIVIAAARRLCVWTLSQSITGLAEMAEGGADFGHETSKSHASYAEIGGRGAKNTSANLSMMWTMAGNGGVRERLLERAY
jgi:hypothetical protein